MHLGKRPVVDFLAGDQLVDRKRGVVAMRHRPYDVLRTEGGVAAEEHLRMRRSHGLGIDLGHIPFVEFDAAIPLDPGERILLTDRDQHVVAGNGLVGLAGGHQVTAALRVVLGLHFLEGDAGELAFVVGEGDRHHEIEDRNILMHGVFFFPGTCFHLLEAGTHDHLDVLAAETARGAAAIHRGIAAAEHDHALADLLDMTKRDAGEPVDADVNIACRILAAGDVELAAARRAGAYEDRVVIFGKQLLQAVDACTASELDAEVENVVAFLVDHRIGKAEFRNLRPHPAAGLRVLIEHDAVVAERREVACYCQRSRTAADDRDPLAVLLADTRHAALDVVLEVGCDSLESANRHRRFLDAAAAARRFAGAIAGAAENSRKHIRSPIDHVGVAITALSDQPDVFWNGRMCGAGPLAVDHFMEIVGRRDISRFHSYLIPAPNFQTRAALSLPANALRRGVLVVFEWYHRLKVLKPINMIHKGNFARSSAFMRRLLKVD